MKKGALSLSVNAIVIIILAITFLGLGVWFINSNLGKAGIKFEQAIVPGAPKPEFEVKSPQDMDIHVVGDEIQFEIFLISTKQNIVGYYWDFQSDGNIDTQEEKPTFSFWEPGDYTVTVKLLNDQGGLGEQTVTVRVFTKNVKTEDKYVSDPVFFIPTTFGATGVSNWQDVLLMLPLTKWFDKEGEHNYDFVAIAKASGDPTATDVETKLSSDGKNHAILFNLPGITLGSSYTSEPYSTSDLADYFGFWSEYDSVVAVASDNEDGALIAALFASYINAPLIFLDSGSMGGYDSFVSGKKMYYIDTIPNDVITHFATLITDRQDFTSEELRDPNRNINRIIEIKSKPEISP